LSTIGRKWKRCPNRRTDKQTDDKNIELVRVPLQHASFLARNQWGGMSPEMKERKKKEESSTNNPDEV